MTPAVIPLAEVLRRVEAALPKLYNTIGRFQLMELCLQCPRAECNVRASNCGAHQRELARKKDQHARKREQRNAAARARRAANLEFNRERNRAYQKDPAYLASLRAKRRVRAAERAAAEGRIYRPRATSPSTHQRPAADQHAG